MGKRIIVSVVVIMAMVFLLVAFATTTMRYDAYESNAKIFFNEQEVEFDAPIVIMNDRTYIPLRETAEKANVLVEWNGTDNAVMLTDISQPVSLYKIFELLFNFALPDSAEILHYDYFAQYAEKHFRGKISFDRQDLEYIKSNISRLITVEDLDWFDYYSRKYDWWDVEDIGEMIYACRGFKSGVELKTIGISFLITEGENDQYYLYVVHG